MLTVDSVRKPLLGDGTIFKMGQNVARYTSVIVDDLALSEAGLGVHDLVKIGECKLLASDLYRS